MKVNALGVITILTFLICGCSNFEKKQDKTVIVDFSLNDTVKQDVNLTDTTRSLCVAVSAIISPRETFIYYEELLSYISKKLNRTINVKQRKTYSEVNQMLLNKEVDMAFICSGAYARIEKIENIKILVVPVCNGKPYYQAYIIANKQRNIEKFEDFKGRKFAFTDPLSNSGKLYAEKRLKDMNISSDNFFSSTMFTHGHDISIQLVSKGLVDGATIDGLIYEYLFAVYPEKVKNVKIIEKSEDYGIPPIVIPPHISQELKQQLQDVFLSLHEDPEGTRILDKLLIERFVKGNDKDYNSIREIQDSI